jgi:F0F1-type ATP synthase epsilon subunit
MKMKKRQKAEAPLLAQLPIDDNANQPSETPPKGQMFIKVYSPYKVYYDGLGTSISAENDTGPFDILVGHHRFLTLLSSCTIEVRVIEGEGKQIQIERGIMYVKQDRVTVFLDV